MQKNLVVANFESIYAEQLGGRTLSSFSPADFRTAIAAQVTNDQFELAEALGEAAISLYPDSEDVLSIVALMAEIREDWVVAAELLQKLMEVQGESTPPAVWQHWIRVLRCLCEPYEALNAANDAVSKYPNDQTLQDELNDLKNWIDDAHLYPTEPSLN
jgi:hypothetical protein